jgi:rsbT co-antagonist protein RsbR
MAQDGTNRVTQLIKKYEADLLPEWIAQLTAAISDSGKLDSADLRAECRSFLSLLQNALARDSSTSSTTPEWVAVRDMLGDLSRSRGLKGFSPSETATFVFSLKKPLFSRIRREFANDAEALADVTWSASELIDTLAIYTTVVYQKTRDEIIMRQQREMLELSTPVVKLWQGILAVPLIGTLDSSRTQVVMETLLQTIVATGCEVAIIDITGVPTVDTLVAQHLIKTVTAARLMGADCIISGIRPQIAQTIVHLGVDLKDISTKATLADALALALDRSNMTVVRARPKT